MTFSGVVLGLFLLISAGLKSFANEVDFRKLNFNIYDVDGDGKITRKEFLGVVDFYLSEGDLDGATIDRIYEGAEKYWISLGFGDFITEGYQLKPYD